MSNLRFYVDSADRSSIEPLLRSWTAYGVTTNPTILAKAGHHLADLPGLYASWNEQGAREVFFQTWGHSREALGDHGRQLAAIGGNVVVKAPATVEGFAAAGSLVAAGVPVLITAVYSVAQAVAAAVIGARYIAPYLGRLNDLGSDGTADVLAMLDVLTGTGTQVLVASVRSADAVATLAAGGVRLFTAAPSVLLSTMSDDRSDAAAQAFEDDMKRVTP